MSKFLRSIGSVPSPKPLRLYWTHVYSDAGKEVSLEEAADELEWQPERWNNYAPFCTQPNEPIVFDPDCWYVGYAPSRGSYAIWRGYWAIENYTGMTVAEALELLVEKAGDLSIA